MADPFPQQRPLREDYQQALQSMGTFVDVSVDDLMTLTERAEQFASRRAGEILTVAHIMSAPVRTVQPTTSLTEAAHLMVSARISGLPVIAEDERLVGIITEADFLRALGVPAHHPSHNLWQTLETLFRHLAYHPQPHAPNDQIGRFMVTEVISARPEQGLGEVIELMKRHRVKRVVVCDERRRVLGMVTRSDLVRVFFDRYADAAGRPAAEASPG